MRLGGPDACEIVSSSGILGLRSSTHSQPAGSPSRRDLRNIPCSLLPLAPGVIMLLSTEAQQLRAEPYSLLWTPLLNGASAPSSSHPDHGRRRQSLEHARLQGSAPAVPATRSPLLSTPWSSQFSDLSLNVASRGLLRIPVYGRCSSAALPHSVFTYRAFVALTCLGAVFLVPVMSQCPVASSRMGVSHTRRPAHTQPSRGPGTRRVFRVFRMDEWLDGLLLSLLVSR